MARTLSYSVLRCFEYCCEIGPQPQSSKTQLCMAWWMVLGLWPLGNATAVTPSKQLLSLPIWSYLPYFKAFTTSNNLAVRRLELLRPPSALRELVKKEPRASEPGSQDITSMSYLRLHPNWSRLLQVQICPLLRTWPHGYAKKNWAS